MRYKFLFVIVRMNLRKSRTKSNKVEQSRTKSNKVEQSRTKSNKVKQSQTKSNKVKQSQTKSNKVKQYKLIEVNFINLVSLIINKLPRPFECYK